MISLAYFIAGYWLGLGTLALGLRVASCFKQQGERDPYASEFRHVDNEDD